MITNNKRLIILITVLFVFVVGFISGMEYKVYQLRVAFRNTFNTDSEESKPDSNTKIPEKENIATINKNLGEDIALSTLNIKVIKSEEQQTLTSKYGQPKVAKENAKFVIVSLELTNTIKGEFSFSPNETIRLQDEQKREYRTYDDTIGNIDNYLNFKDLSPSIKETGVLVYEVPNDATSYSLITTKDMAKELYTINLK